MISFLNAFLLVTFCIVVCQASLKRSFGAMEGDGYVRNMRRRLNSTDNLTLLSKDEPKSRPPLPLQILVLYYLIDYQLENLPRVQLERTNLGLTCGMSYFGKFFSTYSFDEETQELSYEIDLDSLVEYTLNLERHRYSNESVHLDRIFRKAYGINTEALALIYKEDPFRKHFEKLYQKWLSQVFEIILSQGAEHDILFEIFSQRNPAIIYGAEFVLKFCNKLGRISADLLDKFFTCRIDKKHISTNMMERLIELEAPDAVIKRLVTWNGSPQFYKRLLNVSSRSRRSPELEAFLENQLKIAQASIRCRR